MEGKAASGAALTQQSSSKVTLRLLGVLVRHVEMRPATAQASSPQMLPKGAAARAAPPTAAAAESHVGPSERTGNWAEQVLLQGGPRQRRLLGACICD